MVRSAPLRGARNYARSTCCRVILSFGFHMSCYCYFGIGSALILHELLCPRLHICGSFSRPLHSCYGPSVRPDMGHAFHNTMGSVFPFGSICDLATSRHNRLSNRKPLQPLLFGSFTFEFQNQTVPIISSNTHRVLKQYKLLYHYS